MAIIQLGCWSILEEHHRPLSSCGSCGPWAVFWAGGRCGRRAVARRRYHKKMVSSGTGLPGKVAPTCRAVSVQQLRKIENDAVEVNIASFNLCVYTCLHWWTCCFVMPGSLMWPSSKSSHVLTCRPAGGGCHSSTYTRCWPAARLLSGWCWAAAKWLPDITMGSVQTAAELLPDCF